MDQRTLRVLEFDKIIALLAEKTCSPMGRERALALLPSACRTEVGENLADTRDGVTLVLKRGGAPSFKIPDIRQSLERVMAGGGLGTRELLGAAGFLGACRAYRHYAGDEAQEEAWENRQRSRMRHLYTDPELEDRIRRAIRSEDEISDDASPELYSLRRKIRERQEAVRDRLSDALTSSKYSKFIQEPVVTLRDGRYVIPIRQEYRNDFPGIVHDVSASGATLFMEPLSVVEANNDLKQLKIREQMEIERILAVLSRDVADRGTAIADSIEAVAFIDFVFAKAKMALDHAGTEPILDQEGQILLRKARHPLLDRDRVVPVDAGVGREFRTLIITGPNTGGKTVSLKTIGLFALMTQAGLFLPAADGSRMAVFRDVFADIGDEQSIEQSLSTFSSHMRNIVALMREADDKTLVLLDELGAGTDPTEGAALAMSILEHLSQRGSITVATTHYAELKVYAETTPGVENACCEFDVETLKPTYRLIMGIPGRSNAFAISSRLGLDERVILRAREFLSSEQIRFEDLLTSIEKDRKAAREERLEADRLLQEMRRQKEEDDRNRAGLEGKKQALLREAREEARKVLSDARREALDIIKRMHSLEELPDRKTKNREAQELYQNLKLELDRIESQMGNPGEENGGEEGNQEFKPGDPVRLKNLDQKGEVLTPPDKNGNVQVQVGLLRIHVPAASLTRIMETQQTAAKTMAALSSSAKSRTVSASLDVRGLTVSEAVYLLDKYLDDAGLAGLHEIVVIHGKGTGALRKGIHEFLRQQKDIHGFRLGAAGEGDAGVTIVEIRPHAG